MAFKVTARIASITAYSNTEFSAEVQYAVHDGSQNLNRSVQVEPLNPNTLTALQINEAIKNAVKSYVIAQHSVSFGIFDGVFLAGSVL